MTLSVRRLVLTTVLLLALPIEAMAGRVRSAVPPLQGKPCFLQISQVQAVRADAIRDIRATGVGAAHFDVDRGTLYVNGSVDVTLWRRRIMACFEEPSEDPAAPASIPDATPAPAANSAPAAARTGPGRK